MTTKGEKYSEPTVSVQPVDDVEYAAQHIDLDTDSGGKDQLHRGLKQRHIAMMSIGGIIGTGLFLGSGNALIHGGPLGLLLGYSIFGVVVIFLMQGLGEMAAFLPIPGGHLAYAGRFVDPAFGFAMSWCYTLVWWILCPAELSAVAVLMNYWVSETTVNNGVWIAIAFAFVIVMNMFPASVYGETEFIFCSIKVLTIMGLIICGIAINCGAGPDGHYIGGEYWRNPGAFGIDYMGIKGAKGQFLGFWAVLTQAAFSYLGSEIVAVVAAETKNPSKAVPRAIKNVYLRICVFYILGTFIIGMTCPSNDSHLGTASDASASPFVIAISRAGIKVLPSIVNGCLITSAWSAANADIYVASRSIYTLAKQGYLPKVYLTTSKRGVPYVASLTAASGGFLAFMCVSSGANTVFNWFVNLVAVGGLMVYVGICWSYIRFRKACEAQGIERSTLPFTSGYARFGAWFALCFIPIIIFFSGWTVFLDLENFDHATLITNYLPMVLVPIAYLVKKFWSKTKTVGLMEMDLTTGARVKMVAEDDDDDEPQGRWAKITSYLL